MVEGGRKKGEHVSSYLFVVFVDRLTAVFRAVVRSKGNVISGANKGIGRGQVLNCLVLFTSRRRLRVKLDGREGRTGLVMPGQIGAPRPSVD